MARAIVVYSCGMPRLLWAAIPMTALLLAACGSSATPRPVESASPTPSYSTNPAPSSTSTGNARVTPEPPKPAGPLEPLPEPPRTRDGHPIVYVTFDDGPSQRYTNEVLDMLATHHSVATFFVVGKRAMRLPSIVRRALSAGNTVASHSWSHPHLAKLSRGAIAEQLRRTRSTLSTLGASTRCFRPPYSVPRPPPQLPGRRRGVIPRRR